MISPDLPTAEAWRQCLEEYRQYSEAMAREGDCKVDAASAAVQARRQLQACPQESKSSDGDDKA